MQVSNYLFFTTQCEAALQYYAQCRLGAIMEIWRYGENSQPLPHSALKGKVMHARFEGKGVRFFASDNDDAEPMRGFAQLIETDNLEEAKTLFASLADGGRITTPFGLQSWGDQYGKLTDRFGVQWMVNFSG